MTRTPARGEVTDPDRCRMVATSDVFTPCGALVIHDLATGQVHQLTGEDYQQ
jgi:hypothetical protein